MALHLRQAQPDTDVPYRWQDYWRKGKKRLYPTRSDQIKMILELIKEKPHISRSEILHKMGLHESSVKRRLKMMVDKGVIQRIGSDKGGCWQIK